MNSKSNLIGIPLLLLIAIGGFWVWPLVFPKRQPVAQPLCLSNMKQNSLAVRIYIVDWDDRYPQSNWIDCVDKYVKKKDILSCPEVLAEQKKRYGYAMNIDVIGTDAKTDPDPAKTVMLFETDALGRNVVMNLAGRNLDRHKNVGSFVAYADGHARFIGKAKAP